MQIDIGFFFRKEEILIEKSSTKELPDADRNKILSGKGRSYLKTPLPKNRQMQIVIGICRKGIDPN